MLKLNNDRNNFNGWALYASLCVTSVGAALGMGAYRAATSDQHRLNRAQATLVDQFNSEGLQWERKNEKGDMTTFTATSNDGFIVTLVLVRKGPKNLVRVQVNGDNGERMFSYSKYSNDLLPDSDKPVLRLLEGALSSPRRHSSEAVYQTIGHR